MIKMNLQETDELSNRVIGLCIEVHKNLGPGLLESAYQQCLAYELNSKGIKFTMETPIAVKYKGINIDCAFRADFIIEDKIILELKAIKEILPIYEAQILTCLRITGLRLGLIINFNVELLRDGIKRIVF